MNIDVCNGDADGLCSVVQWRLHAPHEARLVTGLKRDIELLDRVQATRGDALLVCDLSMQRNLQPLVRLLLAGASVHYFDHHHVDHVPVHPLLDAHIDFSGTTCTSLLVNRYLCGEFLAWAAVGAYGDNLVEVADRLVAGLALTPANRQRLHGLGKSINYNAYGESEDDVYIQPARLFELLMHYPDPLDFLAHEDVARELETRRQDDLRQAQASPPYLQTGNVGVYLFPDAPWSRRVIGSYGNVLASAEPLRAHALIKATALGDYVVSVRAPLSNPMRAADFCRRFGGDGRAGAAGIDHLAANEFSRFIDALLETRWDDGSPANASGA